MFALKKIVSFFHLLVKIPFGMGLSDHSPKKLSYFIILIISFKIIRACRLVTLICGKQHIIICLKYTGIVACICQNTFNSQEYTFHICTWHMAFPVLPRASGYIVPIQHICFILIMAFFLLSFYSISLFKLVFLYSAMILRLI